MSTKEKLNNDLKDAMRASDELRKMVIRGALSAIKLNEVEKGEELEEADVIGVLQKELKSRRESIADAEKANRPDLIEAAEAEMVILETYLPKGLSDKELAVLVDEAIAESGASSPADMGNVMKVLMPKVKGRADGAQVSNMVRSKLQGS